MQVEVVLRHDGLIRSIRATGHIGGNRGDNLPCGIASAVLKSWGILMAKRASCRLRGAVPGPGDYEMELDVLDTGDIQWIQGAGDLMIHALESLVAQATDGSLSLVVIRVEE